MSLNDNVLWQYAKAPRLESLIDQTDAWFETNDSAFWSTWYHTVFNLSGYNETQFPPLSNFGMALWAIILDVPFSVISPLSDLPSWAFGDKRANFMRGNFSASSSHAASLTKMEKWQVLRLRFYYLVSNGTVWMINDALADVFGDGFAYVLDHEDMTMEYVFTQPISTNLRLVLEAGGILPCVAGVKTIITEA